VIRMTSRGYVGIGAVSVWVLVRSAKGLLAVRASADVTTRFHNGGDDARTPACGAPSYDGHR
jgi:hypothetical protein